MCVCVFYIFSDLFISKISDIISCVIKPLYVMDDFIRDLISVSDHKTIKGHSSYNILVLGIRICMTYPIL